MRDRRRLGLALGVVERRDGQLPDGVRVEAAHVDVNAVGMRAGYVKTLDPAMPAEAVFRRTRVERVFHQVFRAGQQAEARRRHDQVQVAGHAAYRAVAVERFDLRRSLDFEANAAAMAAAAVDDMRGVRGRTHWRSQPLPLPLL